MTFHLDIIASTKRVFSGKVKKIIVPSTTGQLTILPKHMPLIASLDIGEVIVHDEKDNYHHFSIGKGLLQINRNKVNILIEDARAADEISEKEAQMAMEKAKVIIEQKPKGEDLKAALQVFRRSLVDLKITRKIKKRPPL